MKISAYVPVVVWGAIVIFIGGRSNVPTVPTSLPVDKVAHFFMYGILGACAAHAWLRSGRSRSLAGGLILAALLTGAADELNQRRVEGRTSDIADWVADAAGVSAGFWIMAAYSRRQGASTK